MKELKRCVHASCGDNALMHTFSDSDVATRGFQFPGHFEISAMGATGIGLEQALPQLLRQAGVKLQDEHIRLRLSSAGKHVAVRMAFIAQSREQYEAALTAVRGYPGVKWVV